MRTKKHRKYKRNRKRSIHINTKTKRKRPIHINTKIKMLVQKVIINLNKVMKHQMF